MDGSRGSVRIGARDLEREELRSGSARGRGRWKRKRNKRTKGKNAERPLAQGV